MIQISSGTVGCMSLMHLFLCRIGATTTPHCEKPDTQFDGVIEQNITNNERLRLKGMYYDVSIPLYNVIDIRDKSTYSMAV